MVLHLHHQQSMALLSICHTKGIFTPHRRGAEEKHFIRTLHRGILASEALPSPPAHTSGWRDCSIMSEGDRSFPERQFQPPTPAMQLAAEVTQADERTCPELSERKLVAEAERKPCYLNFRTPLLNRQTTKRFYCRITFQQIAVFSQQKTHSAVLLLKIHFYSNSIRLRASPVTRHKQFLPPLHAPVLLSNPHKSNY